MKTVTMNGRLETLRALEATATSALARPWARPLAALAIEEIGGEVAKIERLARAGDEIKTQAEASVVLLTTARERLRNAEAAYNAGTLEDKVAMANHRELVAAQAAVRFLHAQAARASSVSSGTDSGEGRDSFFARRARAADNARTLLALHGRTFVAEESSRVRDGVAVIEDVDDGERALTLLAVLDELAAMRARDLAPKEFRMSAAPRAERTADDFEAFVASVFGHFVARAAEVA